MNSRCKFVCDSIGKRNAGNGNIVYESEFSPVYSSDPNHENRKFWDASPNGSLKLGWLREGGFEPGKEYYLDISLAE